MATADFEPDLLWGHLFLARESEEASNCQVKSFVYGVSVPVLITVGSKQGVTSLFQEDWQLVVNSFFVGLAVHQTLPEG